MDKETIAKLAKLVKTKRPDLMLLTDDVYGTFVNDFRSLMGEIPRNTIGVYSYSKYFGCTGWRRRHRHPRGQHLRRDDREAAAEQPSEGARQALWPIVLEPRKLKFIDRIVADSRDIGLNHTAGLCCPSR